MATVAEWIALLSDQVGRGIYVWGGNGQDLTKMTDPERWISQRETSDENAARAIALFRMRVLAGIGTVRAFDCSGLMHYGLKTLHVIERDLNSRGLYQACKPLSDAADLRPGDLVFRHNGEQIVHVGAYVGDGRVIECVGRDVGVVRSRLDGAGWNRFGRLEGAWTEAPSDKGTVRIKGKSVRVRSTGSTAGRTLCIAHAGDTFPLLGTAETGWYRIALGSGEGYVTNKPRYTEVTDRA